VLPLRGFVDELEKIAATVAVRRFASALRTALPGVAGHPLEANLSAVGSSAVRARLTALRQAAYGKARSVSDLATRRIQALRIEPTRRTTPMQAADQVERVRRSFTGAHAARPGETLIPAAGTAEDVARVKVRSRHLFRGNPVTSTDVALMSRHPDVGAGYSLGRATAGQKVAPSGRLFAFDKARLSRAGEGVADALPEPSLVLGRTERISRAQGAKWYHRPKGSKIQPRVWDHLEHSGKVNPTYEDIVFTKKAPKPVGEYGVRRARTSSGDPAFAIRDVSGKPARSVFAEHSVR
jgi:hypothetical protein